MKHQVAHRNFGRPSGPRRAMFRIMVTNLLKNGRIKTTESKAKEIRPLAEKMITLGKGGTLHERRQAAAFITEDKVVKMVFDEIAPRYKDRDGGYTRLVRLGPRKGDAAEVTLLELIP